MFNVNESVVSGNGSQRAASNVHDRSIGDLISQARNLSAEQVEQVLAYQRKHQVRFGEAAVALNLVSQADVMVAVSQPFQYPYAPEAERADSADGVGLNPPCSGRAVSRPIRRCSCRPCRRPWSARSSRGPPCGRGSRR